MNLKQVCELHSEYILSSYHRSRDFEKYYEILKEKHLKFIGFVCCCGFLFCFVLAWVFLFLISLYKLIGHF